MNKKIKIILSIIFFIIILILAYYFPFKNISNNNINVKVSDKEKEVIIKSNRTQVEIKEIEEKIDEVNEKEVKRLKEKAVDNGPCYLTWGVPSFRINYYNDNGSVKIKDSYIPATVGDRWCSEGRDIFRLKTYDDKLDDVYIKCDEYIKSKQECNKI